LGYSWSYLTQCVAAFLVSTAIVPATIMAFFALKGMWRDFRYCVFDFNFLAFGATENPPIYRGYLELVVIKVIIALFIIVYVVRWVTRVSGNTALAFRRGFVVIVCASYFLAVKTFWPVTSPDNHPPFYPLVAVLCSGALLAVSNVLTGFKWNHARMLRSVPLPVFVALAEIVVLVEMQPIWKDRTKQETDLLRNVLALVQPGDYVLDCKGETVFRQRCVRAVFETITRSAIERGLIADDGPQRCVETRTCVVATRLIKRFPRETRRFVKRNYLAVTKNLRVAGVELKPSSTNPGRYEFEVTIPASYEIICPDKDMSGTLDGVPYNGARFLTAGRHTFESTLPRPDLVLLWAQATARHFTPFKHHS